MRVPPSEFCWAAKRNLDWPVERETFSAGKKVSERSEFFFPEEKVSLAGGHSPKVRYNCSDRTSRNSSRPHLPNSRPRPE